MEVLFRNIRNDFDNPSLSQLPPFETEKQCRTDRNRSFCLREPQLYPSQPGDAGCLLSDFYAGGAFILSIWEIFLGGDLCSIQHFSQTERYFDTGSLFSVLAFHRTEKLADGSYTDCDSFHFVFGIAPDSGLWPVF